MRGGGGGCWHDFRFVFIFGRSQHFRKYQLIVFGSGGAHLEVDCWSIAHLSILRLLKLFEESGFTASLFFAMTGVVMIH